MRAGNTREACAPDQLRLEAAPGALIGGYPFRRRLAAAMAKTAEW
ncbi:hypothetical protein ACH5A3_24375 [Streptomyces echinatus]